MSYLADTTQPETNARQGRRQVVTQPTSALAGVVWFVCVAGPAWAQNDSPARVRPEDTELWQPSPPIVAPGPGSAAAPPADAIVLFGGTDLDEWVSTRDGAPAS